MKIVPDYQLGTINEKPVILNLTTKSYININGQRRLPNDKKIQKLSEQEFLHQYPLDHTKINNSVKVLFDFFNVEAKGSLEDKFGHQYSYLIISNSDCSIGDTLIVDELLLYNEKNEKIGYLKTKYNTPEILSALHKIPVKNNLNNKNKDIFFNTATIDYSRLNEEYQLKGLGYAIYISIWHNI